MNHSHHFRQNLPFPFNHFLGTSANVRLPPCFLVVEEKPMSQDVVLTASQQKVLILIAAGSTATAAAESAGIHRNTVGNWLQVPAFRQALAQAHYGQSLYWREQAENLAADALQAIRYVLSHPLTPESVRLKAALAILDRASAPLPVPEAGLTPKIETLGKCTSPIKRRVPSEEKRDV
jgi:hypothetical protein